METAVAIVHSASRQCPRPCPHRVRSLISLDDRAIVFAQLERREILQEGHRS